MQLEDEINRLKIQKDQHQQRTSITHRNSLDISGINNIINQQQDTSTIN